MDLNRGDPYILNHNGILLGVQDVLVRNGYE